jgi:hypothetical protein
MLSAAWLIPLVKTQLYAHSAAAFGLCVGCTSISDTYHMTPEKREEVLGGLGSCIRQ